MTEGQASGNRTAEKVLITSVMYVDMAPRVIMSNSPEWPPCYCVLMGARIWEITVGLSGEEWRLL